MHTFYPKYFLIGNPLVGYIQTVFNKKSGDESCPLEILTLKIWLNITKNIGKFPARIFTSQKNS